MFVPDKKDKTKKMKLTTLYIEDETDKRITNLANSTGIKRSVLIRQMLAYCLNGEDE